MGTWLGVLVVLGVAACVVSIVWHSLKNGISPTPTARRPSQAIIQALRKRRVKGNVYELGSGFGTLTFTLADYLPDCTIHGYENSPVPYRISLLFQRFLRRANVKQTKADFFKVSLFHAEAIVCYLAPKLMADLRKKFETELTPGTVVVSSTFAVPRWKPIEVIESEDMYNSPIYVYVMPVEYA